MYTMFECRSCGFVWDCEGTPHGDCPKCGGEGMMLHQNGVDFCWQCGEPEHGCSCWGESENESQLTPLAVDGVLVCPSCELELSKDNICPKCFGQYHPATKA